MQNLPLLQYGQKIKHCFEMYIEINGTKSRSKVHRVLFNSDCQTLNELDLASDNELKYGEKIQ